MSVKPTKLSKYMTPLIGLGEHHWQAIDFSIEEYGSRFVVLPVSDAARDWLQNRLGLNREVSGVIVGPEFLDDLIEEIERTKLHITGSQEGEHIDWRSLMNAISKN